MIQDTSLSAYTRATQNPGKPAKGGARRAQDATNADLAARLNWPVNRITPRCLELRKMGLILDAGKLTCKVTGSTAHAWMAKHPVLPEAFRPKTSPKNPQAGSLGI